MSDSFLPAMEMKNVSKSFHFPSGEQYLVFDSINLTLRSGEIVALTGPSGSGKSTLLHIAGLLDTPSMGSIVLMGEDISTMNDRRKTLFRSKCIGFVYQFHFLINEMSALDNVMLPSLISGNSYSEAHDYAMLLLDKMKLFSKVNNMPSQLSGGEKQRVAVCRALVNKPKIILADEPTGSLDHETAEIVIHEIMSMARDVGLSAIIATHNRKHALNMDYSLELCNGRISEHNGI